MFYMRERYPRMRLVCTSRPDMCRLGLTLRCLVDLKAKIFVKTRRIVYQNKLSLLICFRKKMSFTGETSTIEKDAKYRSVTKNINFFCYNVYFIFQKVGNSQTY